LKQILENRGRKRVEFLSHIHTVHSVEISRAPYYYNIYCIFKLNEKVEIKNLCNETAILFHLNASLWKTLKPMYVSKFAMGRTADIMLSSEASEAQQPWRKFTKHEGTLDHSEQ
jgi:hypothetical protein